MCSCQLRCTATHDLRVATVQGLDEHGNCANVGAGTQCSQRQHQHFLTHSAAFFQSAMLMPILGAADFSSPSCAGKARAKCAGPWSKCAASPENCNTTQIAAMNTYISDFMKAMDQTVTFGKPGNGAFIHSCHTHCEAQTSADWTKFAVDGVTIQQAVGKWWDAPEGDPAAKHTYKPCEYKTGTGRHECNPTCGGSS